MDLLDFYVFQHRHKVDWKATRVNVREYVRKTFPNKDLIEKSILTEQILGQMKVMRKNARVYILYDWQMRERSKNGEITD